jgi:acyl-CoA synthetase (AMP-forming)/AMP-acid ligase II
MANYKVPRSVAVVDALPLNAVGKVQKFVLRDEFSRAGTPGGTAPGSAG